MKFETYTYLGAISYDCGPRCLEDGSAFETRCATGISKVFEKVIIWVAPTARSIIAANFSVMIANMKFEG